MTLYELDEIQVPEPYCDYCEKDGHSFSQCPKRDDEDEAEWI